MICSATRSCIFWRMKASSRCGTSFQRVVSATLLRISVASNLQCSSHPLRQATFDKEVLRLASALVGAPGYHQAATAEQGAEGNRGRGALHARAVHLVLPLVHNGQ